MIPALITAAAVAVGASVPIMIWAIVGDRDPARRPVLDNLSAGLDLAQVDGSATVAPPSLLRRTTTPGTMARLDRLLSRAGRPPAWPVEKIAAGKLVLAGAMGALGVLFLLPEPAPVRIALVTVVVVVAYFTPELLLHSRGEERQQQIDLALPDTLDQMTIAVEAGLGFEAAMSRAAKNGKGPLAEEFVRTLQDIQMGKSRRGAYLDLAARTNAPNLRRFLRAVIQADEYGVAIADVLRTQAGEMRMKRRQRAEERAMQLPVKVIFPLLLCILPTLFIVLLGPAVMGIVEAFGQAG
ncbi:type II secretion system F family protein [Prescottella equi]|uniref:Type II secretion system F family protein n=1 Tax=Rhodococcus hoagii TaxID=43767 RepID=A0A9Q2PLQ2_RHOHA|nr:type II secretion system F family protein [Prescottella equi]MBM4488032.1 type II secretion system F family protein [Prescottella equi]MBM4495476.1 type II secretion system F family protein [Prescottella equi]MBM4499213.1 type II secretion system F family protein [Prescottella equi]MBM4504037.1 type II secretion system F family protein [Prescottella equi]MBM4517821.1 type II secretion system F family protein [Prescottella equi]